MLEPRIAMALFILGLSHKTAPVEVREKIAFDAGQLPSALGALKAQTGIAESMILSTCNRTEIYCDLDLQADTEPMTWLSEYWELGPMEIEPHLYRLDNEHAVRHVLRVACGLDSLVLGEPQILGQLKEAYRQAVEAGTVGSLLNRLLQFSFSTAKLVRAETDVGNTPVSVAYAAVKLAHQIHGDLAERSALLIGAGDTINLVANHLAGSNIGHLIIANRTRENSAALAARYGGEVIDLNQLPKRLKDVDIVVSSTASRLPIVTRGVVEVSMEERHYESMFIVDLAVPRDVEAGVAEVQDVYLYTVDDLEGVVNANMQLRKEAAARAEDMVQIQVQDYMDWLEVQSSGATIAAFRARAESVRDEALDKAFKRLARGDDPEEIMRMLAHTLTNKLLHRPTTRLRRPGTDEEFLRIARELLDLGEP
jgi:glutamyl-tRNA reductase